MKSKLFTFKSIALFGIAMLFVANGVCQNQTTTTDDKDTSPAVIIKSTNLSPTESDPYGKPIQSSEVVVTEKNATTKKQTEIRDDSTPYYTVNEMPVYLDGKRELPNYVSRTAKYPVEARKDKAQGIVIVQIIVEKNGSVSNPQVVQSVHPKLDEEALRVVGTLKGFIPGKQNGEAVRCYYQIPVPFVLMETKQ